MASDNSLRIKVGAALDSNVKSVYKPLVETTKQAARDILIVWRKLSQDMSSVFADGMLKTRVGVRTDAADISKSLSTTGKGIDSIKDKFGSLRLAAKNGLDITGLAKTTSEELAKVEQAAVRAQRTMSGGGGSNSFGARTGYWSMRYADNMVRSGIHFASSIARGAGLDFNLGSMVRGVQEQKLLATEISNEGFMPGGSVVANQRRVSGDEIRKRTSEAADYAGFDRHATLGAIQTFVGKTGDLDAGLASLKTMGKIARATGSDMNDLVSASGDFSNVLGDIPDKGKEIEQVMKALAGQAKTGAVSIRDLPTSMVKLTSQARNFTIDPETRAMFAAQGIKTDVGMGVASMGILAQAAKQRGGATTAGVATQDAMAFIRDASTHAEMTRWSAAGLNVFADAGKTKVRDPKQLILEALRYSQGDLSKMTYLMPNKSSRAVLQAFASQYTQAGGGQKGLEAASNYYNEIGKNAMGDKELDESFAAAMKETIPNVQIFENKLQDVAEKISGKIIPAFEKLEPFILQATEAFGKTVAWAADNPGEAITAAIVASIARASIENAFRGAVEAAIGRVTGSGGGGGYSRGSLGGGLGIAGNLMAGLSIASLAVASATIGMATIDQFFKKKDDENRKAVGDDMIEDNAKRGIVIDPKTGEGRAMTQAEKDAYAGRKRGGAQSKVDADLAAIKYDQASDLAKYGAGYVGSKTREDQAKYLSDQKSLEQIVDELKQLNATLGPNTSPIEVKPVYGPPAPTPADYGNTTGGTRAIPAPAFDPTAG